MIYSLNHRFQKLTSHKGLPSSKEFQHLFSALHIRKFQESILTFTECINPNSVFYSVQTITKRINQVHKLCWRCSCCSHCTAKCHISNDTMNLLPSITNSPDMLSTNFFTHRTKRCKMVFIFCVKNWHMAHLTALSSSLSFILADRR